MGKSSAEQTTAMAALTSAEPRPLSEPAKATMQTSNGARSETSMKCWSTKMATEAVAAVRAGPRIARQLSCMRFGFLTGITTAVWLMVAPPEDFRVLSLKGG